MEWQAWVTVGVAFTEVLLLVYVGRFLARLVARRSFKAELTTRDNPAAAMTAGGFHLALFVGLAGLLVGEAASSLGREVLAIGIHGLLLTVLLLASAALWRATLGIGLAQHVCEERNAAAGLVCGVSLVATGLIYQGSVQGEGSWVTSVVFFALGQCMLVAASLYYDWVSPVDVRREVVEKANIAAGLGQAGALLATGLVVGHAAEGDFTSWRESLKDFFLLLMPVLALPLVRFLVARGILLEFADLNQEVRDDRNAAAGLIEAVAYVGCAILYIHLI